MINQTGRERTVKASVVIPVKNGGELLRRVLAAVTDQETPWTYEVLVIDSGSTDGSSEVVRAFDGVALHTIDPGEFGHGRTRNLGAALTRGEYVAYLTQDALPADRHWLRRLVAALEADPAIAGAFGRHLPYPDAGPLTARELREHFAGFGSADTIHRIEDPQRYRRDPGYRQRLHFFSNNNSCLRRSVWERIPFPEVDFAEDQLWARTVIEAGYATVYVPGACVYHSHDFGVLETFRRAFDEGRAFKRYFDYDLVPGVSVLLRQWPRLTWRDWTWVAEAGLPLSRRWSWQVRVPFRVLARLAGYYAGGRSAGRLPAWVERRMSRDQTLQAMEGPGSE